MGSGFSPWIFCPAKRISPLTGAIRPDIARSVVVLPAPLEPSSVTISPSSTDRSSPFNTSPAP